ncbi:MAG: enoyl-CoA hydratase/isomerase family protein [Actinomycetota bacterium]
MSAPTLDRDGPRATLRLNRPDKRNRVEPDDLVRLIELCDEIDADDEVRVVVLTADGPSFCAGYHLGALTDPTPQTVGFGDLCDRVEALRVPTIARINGSIHGGGTDLAIACDLRVGHPDVTLQMPAAKLGIQYYATGLRRFVEQIGPGATKRLFLTALPMTADELLRIDYLHEVVPLDELDDRVDAVADAVAELAPLAVASTKAAINGLAAGTLTVDDVQATHRASLSSADHREALAALSEKRPPRFNGR